jgi:uncharacterized protein
MGYGGRKMVKWRCVRQCGACCHLAPEERPDLEECLSPQEVSLYLSLVGEDGWCVHFDQKTRKCGIYLTRPRFCRVAPETFQDMYGIKPEDLDDFAIECCHQQIESMYGRLSVEMLRFNQEIWTSERPSGMNQDSKPKKTQTYEQNRK